MDFKPDPTKFFNQIRNRCEFGLKLEGSGEKKKIPSKRSLRQPKKSPKVALDPSLKDYTGSEPPWNLDPEAT